MGERRAATTSDDLAVLARHHRECEHIAEEMAALLREVAQNADRLQPLRMRLALRDRIAEVHDRWEAHQWPDLESRLSAPPVSLDSGDE